MRLQGKKNKIIIIIGAKFEPTSRTSRKKFEKIK